MQNHSPSVLRIKHISAISSGKAIDYFVADWFRAEPMNALLENIIIYDEYDNGILYALSILRMVYINFIEKFLLS